MDTIPGLLLLEMPTEGVQMLLDDIAADIGPDMLSILVEAGVEARVFGVMCERRLAGLKTPHVWEALVLAGCEGEVARVVRERDTLKLTERDVQSLSKQALNAACEVTRKRNAKQARRVNSKLAFVNL